MGGRSIGAGGCVVGLASVVGLAAFFYPFALPAVSAVASAQRSARASQAPLVLAGVTAACLVVVLAELGDRGRFGSSASKTVALLGVLVAIDATLRLLPSLLGASPIFLLIILVGAVFGPSFGFLMGALTLLVSAFLIGGIGPWLPYQMLGAGWVGLGAGWLPRPPDVRFRAALIAAYGAIAGLLYGALLNLYAWPYSAPGVSANVGLYWSPELVLAETIERYGRFYLVTSLGHDLSRAVGNAALVLLLGVPLLRLLERVRRRFSWSGGPTAGVVGTLLRAERSTPR